MVVKRQVGDDTGSRERTGTNAENIIGTKGIGPGFHTLHDDSGADTIAPHKLSGDSRIERLFLNLSIGQVHEQQLAHIAV